MKEKTSSGAVLKLFLLLAALLIAFISLTCLYQVRTGESAVLTTFERPAPSAVTEPGLHLKAPWPVQKAYVFDTRKCLFTSPYMEYLVKDGFNIATRLFVVWSIKDAALYKNKVGALASGAEKVILDLVLKNMKTVMSESSLEDLMKNEKGANGLASPEGKILAMTAAESLPQYGIEVSFVGFDRLELPEDSVEAVFARMRSERMKMVTKISEEGKAKAERIKKDADLAKSRILAEADAEAVRIKGEADTKAFEELSVYDKDPEFALFLRKLQALEDSMKTKTTIVIDRDTVPFDLLSGFSEKDLSAPDAEAKNK